MAASGLDRKRKCRAKAALEKAVLVYRSCGGDALQEVKETLSAANRAHLTVLRSSDLGNAAERFRRIAEARAA